MIWLLACLHRGAPVEPAPRPTSAPISHVARAHYLAAHVHIARGNLEAAASSYKRAVLFDDDAPRLYLELGQLRLLQGDPEAALAWLDEAIALGADAPAHLSRAQALFELGRLDEAENIWKGTPPSPERAPLSLQLGYPRQAIAEAAPDDLDLLIRAARAGGLCGPALQRAEEGLKADPWRTTPLWGYAALAHECGVYDEERAALLRLQAMDEPTSEALIQNAAQLGLPVPADAGCALRASSLREEDLDEALGLLQWCADFTTTEKQELGFSWSLQAGRPVEPLTDLQKAEVAARDGDWERVEHFADGSARGLALRGRAALGREEFTSASKLLERSLEMAPGDAEAVAWAHQARYQRPDREPEL